ncbi:hypothetical protein M153_1520007213 [Pseudoloma neurophilia]|uniref:Uncharacterized protein n=1 Tax=Pseudoloma neurophilia TaxID=146866 RepID=A0A0R0M6L0_9MICR|nr:hypothetical protein M153_1520007213 [Pseudoloma neurophilia]
MVQVSENNTVSMDEVESKFSSLYFTSEILGKSCSLFIDTGSKLNFINGKKFNLTSTKINLLHEKPLKNQYGNGQIEDLSMSVNLDVQLKDDPKLLNIVFFVHDSLPVDYVSGLKSCIK